MRKIFCLILVFSMFVIVGRSQSLTPQKQSQLQQLNEMLNKYKNEGNKSETANYLNKIAYLYWENGNSKEAINYFDQSLQINQEIGNENATKTIYLNFGMIYTDINQLDKAQNAYQKSLQISRKLKKSTDIASCLINLASVHTALKKYNDAIGELEEAMNISKELNNEKLLRNCYGKLSENYKFVGNTSKSTEYYELYTTFDKYVQNKEFKQIQDEKDNQINQLHNVTNKIEAEKDSTESRLKITVSSLKEYENLSIEQKKQIYTLSLENQLKEFKNIENETKLRNARVLVVFIVGFAVLLAVIAILSYRAYKHKKKTNAELNAQNIEILNQKEEIASQNIKITDSITYAQRIQEAFLSSEDSLRKHLPNSFIYYKPRDIVSGDFYWFIETGENSPFNNINQIKTEKEDKFLISAVDCTGHGVPGAFMSMIGYNQLNAIVFRGITQANEILNELHKGIRSALRQYKNDNRDGMDMAICVYNKSNNTIDYAGAKNPLIFIKDNEINLIKGNRFPIGGIQTEQSREFAKHTIKIDKKTTFYIFSDGFIDQFGGEYGDKYSLKKFSELLLSISAENMDEQKIKLDEAFAKWKGNDNTQVDDILIIGFQLLPV